MDLRIPIAVALGVAYSVWVAAHAVRDPAVDFVRLRTYARYSLLAGGALLVFTLVLHTDGRSVSGLLVGRNQSFRTIGGLALGYSLIAASGIFWLASLLYRDRA